MKASWENIPPKLNKHTFISSFWIQVRESRLRMGTTLRRGSKSWKWVFLHWCYKVCFWTWDHLWNPSLAKISNWAIESNLQHPTVEMSKSWMQHHLGAPTCNFYQTIGLASPPTPGRWVKIWPLSIALQVPFIGAYGLNKKSHLKIHWRVFFQLSRLFYVWTCSLGNL